MRSSRLAALALACGVAAVAETAVTTREAHAQTSSELAAAQRWFAEGLAFEGSARWTEALERFRRVAAVKHTPQVDFHVGLGEEHVGELVAATVDLRRALDAASAQHVANVERAATTELERLGPRVPHLQIILPVSPTSAVTKVTKVTLDERPLSVVALGEPIAVDPGAHVVTVSFGSGDVTRNVTMAERQLAKVPFEPPRAEAAATPVATSAPEDATKPSPPTETTDTGRSSTPGWVLVGAGGAAVIGGAVFWALRGHEESTLDAACGAGGAHCPSSVHSDYTAGKTDSAVSIALFAAGAASAGAGIVWLVTRGHGSSPQDARLTPTVSPVFFPGGAGASVAARF